MNARETYLLWKRRAVEDPALVRELERLEDEGELEDRFGRELTFGTGGLRGVLGAGTNRMNMYTVRKATQGLASFLREQSPSPSAAVAYDTRINSELFAREAARVLAANGVAVYLYDRVAPTPALSYAVRHYGCGAGICITASHNPAKYNGYKVYGPDGCQITVEAAAAIQERIAAADPFDMGDLPDCGDAVARGLVHMVGDEVLDRFCGAVKMLSLEADTDTPLKVVYTPLNGAGLECVTRVLGDRSVEVVVVPEQAAPDGDFPTCPYPNPEERAALALGLALCEAEKPDLLLATDPDCDRVGIAVGHGGGYRLLTGNEVGVLLLDYLCKRRTELGGMPRNPVAVTTIVSTDMAGPVAEKYGVALRRVLTGFKFIGEQIGLLEREGAADRYLFGFEESYGYLSGTHVRDKDAVNAALLICDMARHYKARGKTLWDAMEALYKEHGHYRSGLDSVLFEGPAGQDKMAALMDRLRAAPPAVLGGFAVERVVDYAGGVAATAEHPCALPPSDVLELRLDRGCKLILRPSGTEPKMKLYTSVRGSGADDSQALLARLQAAGKELMAKAAGE